MASLANLVVTLDIDDGAATHAHETVVCPGCLGSGMSSRTNEGGPERCEACAGVGHWTAAEKAEYDRWCASLDREIERNNTEVPF